MKRLGDLSPHDLVALGYPAVVTLLILVFHQRIPRWELWAGLHLAAVALVLGLALGLPRRPAGARRLVRLWYPLAMVPALYRALEALVPAVHPRDWDAELALADRALFGADPARWLEPLSTPWLTELFQLAYVSFYAMPVAIGLALFRRHRDAEFEIAAAAIAGGFFASFLLYFVVPALGPRFHLAAALEPLPTFEASAVTRRMLNLLEGLQRDAFPSGHAAVGLICLELARRYDRRQIAWLAPAVALMLLSAVYLRYHYVVDLVAGAVLALLALWAVAALDRRRRAASDEATPAIDRGV